MVYVRALIHTPIAMRKGENLSLCALRVGAAVSHTGLTYVTDIRLYTRQYSSKAVQRKPYRHRTYTAGITLHKYEIKPYDLSKLKRTLHVVEIRHG